MDRIQEKNRKKMKSGIQTLNTNSDLVNNFLWEDKYEGNEGSVLVSPLVSGKNLLAILGYKKINDVYTELKDKVCSDIGSGLGGFIFEIEDSVKIINAIDPLYASKTKEDLLEREIKRGKKRAEMNGIEDKINIAIGDINKINDYINDLDMLSLKMPGNIELIDKLERAKGLLSKKNNMIYIMKQNKKLYEEVFEDMKKWESRGFADSNKINIVGSGGENTPLQANSQDFVFITNTIDKSSVNYKKILIESYRILKDSGRLIISDDSFFEKDEIKNNIYIQRKIEKKGNISILNINKVNIADILK